jgi:hypothetical protein
MYAGIDRERERRGERERGRERERCYIIYTSGAHGWEAGPQLQKWAHFLSL